MKKLLKFMMAILASMIGTFLAFTVFFLFLISSFVTLGTFLGGTQLKWEGHQWGTEFSQIKDSSVLRLVLEGVLQDRSPAFSYSVIFQDQPDAIGLYEITQTLRAAAKDDRIKALLIEFRNLKSGIANMESLRSEVLKFKESGKPVIAYGESYSEKDYIVASVADEVALYPKGVFEWNGLFAKLIYFKNSLNKLEVVPQVFRTGKYKSGVEPFTEEKMSVSQREQLDAILEVSWSQVLKYASEKTQLSFSELNSLAENYHLFLALQAKEKGFVDLLASESDIEERLMNIVGVQDDDSHKIIGLSALSAFNGSATSESMSTREPPNSFPRPHSSNDHSTSDSHASNALDDKLEPVSVEELGPESESVSVGDSCSTDCVNYVSWKSFYRQVVTPDLKSMKNIEKSWKKDKVAVIFASGGIQGDSSESTGVIGSKEFSEIMGKVVRDDDIKAVVLRINSPGGGFLASDVIWSSTKRFKGKKPLVASFGNVAASGGYYIAMGSDYIFSEPTTVTGSIGVFGIYPSTENFFKNKVGVTFDTVKTHPFADTMMTERLLNSEERTRIQGMIDYFYQDFLNVVADGRSTFKAAEEAHKVAQGRVWIGKEAKEKGLVDELGNLMQAIDKSVELAELEDYEIVLYPRARSPWEEIFRHFMDVSVGWGEQFLPDLLTDIIRERTDGRASPFHIHARLPFSIDIN